MKFKSLEQAEDWVDLVIAAMSGGQTDTQAMGAADRVCKEYNLRLEVLKRELSQARIPSRRW